MRTVVSGSIRDNVASVFGSKISKELLRVEKTEADFDARLKVRKMTAEISNVNFHNSAAKKFAFLLFINHRLVENSSLKRGLEQVYGAYLPKGSHPPFVYLSLELDPRNVDVNVHPTKHEVHFLYQEEIIEAVQRSIDEALMGSNKSRVFHLHGVPNAAKIADTNSVQQKNLVRTDAKEQKLDRFLISNPNSINLTADQPVNSSASILKNSDESESNQNFSASTSSNPDETPTSVSEGPKQRSPEVVSVSVTPSRLKSPFPATPKVKEHLREVRLNSVKRLRRRILENCHQGLKDLMTDHSFVGCVDRKWSLLQHGVKLYIVNTESVSEELFYQLMLRDFGNFGCIRLNPPAPLSDLAKLALEGEEDAEEAARNVVQRLVEKSAMLDDYFSLQIDSEGNLKTLPMFTGALMERFVPDFSGLPDFAVRLASEVDWSSEEACFDSFCRETAKFYSVKNGQMGDYDERQHDPDHESDGKEKWKRMIEQIIFGGCKRFLNPPKRFVQDKIFVQVANLPDLYKVFERC